MSNYCIEVDGIEFKGSYSFEEDEDVTTFLEEHTMVIGVTASGNVVYQQF